MSKKNLESHTPIPTRNKKEFLQDSGLVSQSGTVDIISGEIVKVLAKCLYLPNIKNRPNLASAYVDYEAGRIVSCDGHIAIAFDIEKREGKTGVLIDILEMSKIKGDWQIGTVMCVNNANGAKVKCLDHEYVPYERVFPNEAECVPVKSFFIVETFSRFMSAVKNIKDCELDFIGSNKPDGGFLVKISKNYTSMGSAVIMQARRKPVGGSNEAS